MADRKFTKKKIELDENERLYKIILDMKGVRVTVVGDIILDRYSSGDIGRISPEAPVNILDIEDEKFNLGGAANVALNISRLGADVDLLGLIGKDSDANEILSLLKRESISSRYIVKDANRSTSSKTRYIALRQQVLRVDREDTFEISNDILNEVENQFEKAVLDSDLVIISDYKKGLLTKSLLKRIISIARAKKIQILVDPKGSDYSIYKGATLITPNQKEASIASGIEIKSEDQLNKSGRSLLKITGADQILITRGRLGMRLFYKDGSYRDFSANAVEVFDVSGAGDTVIATLGLSLARKYPIEDGARLANIAAGISVAHLGAKGIRKEELIHHLVKTQSGSHKFLSRSDQKLYIAEAKKAKRRIVFTNGCFDILHRGHIELLEYAKQLADILVVAINSDRSVKRIKSDERPINSEEDRARMLEALAAVDIVMIFDESTPLKLIKSIKPDILLKGGDYKAKEVVGYDFVKSYGGEVEIFRLIEGRSTSGLIDRIRDGD